MFTNVIRQVSQFWQGGILCFVRTLIVHILIGILGPNLARWYPNTRLVSIISFKETFSTHQSPWHRYGWLPEKKLYRLSIRYLWYLHRKRQTYVFSLITAWKVCTVENRRRSNFCAVVFVLWYIKNIDTYNLCIYSIFASYVTVSRSLVLKFNIFCYSWYFLFLLFSSYPLFYERNFFFYYQICHIMIWLMAYDFKYYVSADKTIYSLF